MCLAAHFIYAQSGTVHGNINPNAMYMDRTTGRGFLVDWEYPAHDVAPAMYVPCCVSTVSSVVTSSDAVHIRLARPA